MKKHIFSAPFVGAVLLPVSFAPPVADQDTAIPLHRENNYLAQGAAQFPQAFTCCDYREAFAKQVDRFPIHYFDTSQEPTAAQLRIPESVKDWMRTAVVCEGGTLVMDCDGGMKI